MGNECDQCEPNGGCARQVLGRGMQPRAKLDLSRVNQEVIQQKKIRLEIRENDHKNLYTQVSMDQQLNKKACESTYQKENDSQERSIEIIELDNGIIFEGEMKNNFRDGNAKYIWPDKTTIETSYSRDQMQTKVRVNIPEQLNYQGEINNEGKISGRGLIRLPDGSEYQGEWCKNKPHGKGIHRLSNGSIYEGQFLDGEKTGHGKFIFSNGNLYQGNFLSGYFHGEGTMKYIDGKSFTGLWKKGIIHGQGSMCYDSQKKYIGSFKVGVRHGYGVYHFGDGRSWEGEWQNNYQNGRGKYIQGSKVQEGYWKNGHKIQSSQRVFQGQSALMNRNKEKIRIEE